MMDLLPLEREVLAALLDGDEGVRGVLRTQCHDVRVRSRELTGVGFYTNLAIAPDAPRLDPSIHVEPITGVNADIIGLEHGASFVLFVHDGAIDFLEGFSFDEPWPASVEHYRVFRE